MNRTTISNPLELFSQYMKVTGVPTLSHQSAENPKLRNKTVGIINGATWITLWSNYFAGRYLPGVKLVNVGNEAVQLNFMAAHERGDEVPPQRNKELFAEYARELLELVHIDALIVTCSTMNRAIHVVRDAAASSGVPVVQIDEPMMEQAVALGGPLLVVATHGPTVGSTTALLRETAARLGRPEPEVRGLTIEECFDHLGTGDIRKHNDIIADGIRSALADGPLRGVVLAQLSMAVFLLSFPEPEQEFGIPVLTSAQCGFERLREILEEQPAH